MIPTLIQTFKMKRSFVSIKIEMQTIQESKRVKKFAAGLRHSFGIQECTKRGRRMRITETHKLKRINLANTLLAWPQATLNKIIWTNEKLFKCGVHESSQFYIAPKDGQGKPTRRNRRWCWGKGLMAWLGISDDHGLFSHVFEPNGGCTYENTHKVSGEVILQSFERFHGVPCGTRVQCYITNGQRHCAQFGESKSRPVKTLLCWTDSPIPPTPHTWLDNCACHHIPNNNPDENTASLLRGVVFC